MLTAALVTLLLSLSSPARATAAANPAKPAKTTTPAPLLPLRVELPLLATKPSHPIKIEVPGVAKVEVDLPDVPALLNGKKAASAPAPSTSPRPSTPTPSTRPRVAAAPTKAPAAASKPVRRAVVTALAAAPTASVDRAEPVSVERAVADPDSAPAAKKVAPKERTAAEAFRGMLRGELPVWLLATIVALCGAGTVVVVRSGRRRDAA